MTFVIVHLLVAAGADDINTATSRTLWPASDGQHSGRHKTQKVNFKESVKFTFTKNYSKTADTVNEGGIAMLPTRIYESLPYAYLLAGLACLALLPHPLGAWSGLILMNAGAMVWIMRAERRRLNHKSGANGLLALPFWLYELQPFAYLCIGCFIFFRCDNQYLYPSAFILCLVGLLIWRLRYQHRFQD